MEGELKIAQMQSHSGINGVVTSLEELIRLQLARGHEILLVHPPGSWLAERLSDVPVDKLETRFGNRLGEFFRVGHAVRDWGAQIVHTHGSNAHKYGAVFRVGGPVPIVATAHSTNFQLHWIFNNRVIAPSRRTARYHNRINRVPKRHLRVIPYPFELSHRPEPGPAERKAARTRLGLPDRCFALGMVGTICERKQQIEAVRVLVSLRDRNIDARLALVGNIGDDAHRGPLMELIETAKLGDRVLLPGAIRDADRLMPGFDAYINTSTEEQGPLSVVEAMAAALPVITTDVGNMDFLLGDGQGGRVFEIGAVAAMADYAAELAGDAALRRQTGEQARAVVADRLRPDVVLPQIESVYRELARRRS